MVDAMYDAGYSAGLRRGHALIKEWENGVSDIGQLALLKAVSGSVSKEIGANQSNPVEAPMTVKIEAPDQICAALYRGL